MRFRNAALPFSLLLLIDAQAASADSIFSRSLHRAHGAAKRHTKSLAKDLRIAFGSVLVSRQQQSQQASFDTNEHKVYCKAGSSLEGGGEGNDDDGGNGDSDTSSSATRTPSGTATSISTSPSATPSTVDTPWKLVDLHQGESFFDGWDFWDTGDPTHGKVDYVSEADGRSGGLVEVNDEGHAIMRVDTTPEVDEFRKSIRIHSKKSYNFMLLIMDTVHMPTGCGSWPAFWTNGPNWPAGGEIDIVEGVSDYTNNQATIHTASGCHLPTDQRSVLGIKGDLVGGTNCAAYETGNQGCGVRSRNRNSFGKALNDKGGGVFAMQWDEDGISIYFFPRDSIPGDIEADTPAPWLWGSPEARWPSESCDMKKYFYDNLAIFDTTLCGDWAGEIWNEGGIIPGQEQSCAARTGYSTCEEYIRKEGRAFEDAYWQVRYVKVFQT